MSSVDYLIIGAGPAGVCAANILAKTGKKTVIVSKNLGGTFCFDGRVVLNSLLHISSLYDKHKQAMQFFSDVPTSPAKIDFKNFPLKLVASKRLLKEIQVSRNTSDD